MAGFNDSSTKGTTEVIQKKAYELWEKEGRKQGCAMHYWLKAEKAVKSQSKSRF